MCYPASSIVRLDHYNWDGDEIIHEEAIPSSRPVVGLASKHKNYSIDIREFLVSERNCILRKAIDVELSKFINKIPNGDWAKFNSRKDGSFDYRANMLAAYVSKRIHYTIKEKVGKYWLFPDETLHIKAGDCEDRAFLLASLMLASGISGYNIRVALGQVKYYVGSSKPQIFDHVWVMYKNERGRWLLFEPLHVNHPSKNIRRKRVPSVPTSGVTRIEYVPWFLFNDAHLWRVVTSDVRPNFKNSIQKKWNRFDPTFAGQVHRNIIIDEALKGAPPWFIDGLKRNYLAVPFSQSYVDKVDLPFTYDPRDHFDNGYIDEGWQKIIENMKKFKADNHDLDSFALSTHAIADFYAHTTYAHFARLDTSDPQKPKVQVYNPENPGIWYTKKPDYSKNSEIDLASGNFSFNKRYWNKSRDQIPSVWNGKIISGRYAQRSDSQDFIERFVYIPSGLENRNDFPERGSLPHHNEIAVDDSTIKDNSKHKLYSPKNIPGKEHLFFGNQFLWRKNAAIIHVRDVFKKNWNG
jgi:hypothetical protein